MIPGIDGTKCHGTGRIGLDWNTKRGQPLNHVWITQFSSTPPLLHYSHFNPLIQPPRLVFASHTDIRDFDFRPNFRPPRPPSTLARFNQPFLKYLLFMEVSFAHSALLQRPPLWSWCPGHAVNYVLNLLIFRRYVYSLAHAPLSKPWKPFLLANKTLAWLATVPRCKKTHVFQLEHTQAVIFHCRQKSKQATVFLSSLTGG
jgi:hypothetical protein